MTEEKARKEREDAAMEFCLNGILGLRTTEENTRYAAYGDVHEARRQVAEEVIKRLREGWCGHCACQSCYDAKRKADHW